MSRKILIMGLPGAGKTTLARALAPRLNAVHFNSDEVRREINADLGFSEPDRIEHARRMGWLCDQVIGTGCFAVADFICPTEATRAAFTRGGPAFIVWVDRVSAGRFEDTNRMFAPPAQFDLRVSAEGTLTIGRNRSQRGATCFRPEAAHRHFHRPVPAVPRWSQGPDRRGAPSGWTGLHRGPRHRRDR